MKILKEPVMSVGSLKQLQFESTAWKRELAFIIGEKYETICNHLGITEKQFRNLKKEFNSYLFANF